VKGAAVSIAVTILAELDVRRFSTSPMRGSLPRTGPGGPESPLGESLDIVSSAAK
jgi:hypothetical protein